MSGKISKADGHVANDELGLTRFTLARVSLGRVGPAIPTREQLRFQLDHALARDAVHARLDIHALAHELLQRGIESVPLRSATVEGLKSSDRSAYLRRPDLGRRLGANSAKELKAL